MKKYDMIAIGSGSSMNIISTLLDYNDHMKVAVIDKDEPGGICLTRGCIPSKLLVYPAQLVRTIQHAATLGIKANLDIDFEFIMNRMRNEIGEDIANIRNGLINSEDIDYYTEIAQFTKPYVLKVGNEEITSKKILLCLGSKPYIPNIVNVNNVEFLTSKSFLQMTKRPKSMIIIGAGYIAAEYGHFMSAMGTEVTVIGRNQQFLSEQEPEISKLALKNMRQFFSIFTGFEVIELKRNGDNKVVIAKSQDGEIIEKQAEEILMATGRISNSHFTNPEKGGIETDDHGWIKVDKGMRTSQEGVYSFGDAIGGYLFKHVANQESVVALYNILGHNREMSYHAVPGAVFTYPEIAYVGLSQVEAIEKYGRENIKIGFQKYENTAKGNAMGLKDYFVKVILTEEDNLILGCHIIGPQASDLIQEVITLMNTEPKTPDPIERGMHIHPALSEVVERAFSGYLSVDHYTHTLHEMQLI